LRNGLKWSIVTEALTALFWTNPPSPSLLADATEIQKETALALLAP